MNFLENKALIYEIEQQNQYATRRSFDDVMMWYEMEKIFNCESDAWEPERKESLMHKVAVTVAEKLRYLADAIDPAKNQRYQVKWNA